ncbi:hypothetical protein PybrP1_000870 [[Pythium] brassicae (nom. inval.)]|nr:hypothetical protein PybrP1_000870 [[Pythium] brassicae (nom. inval.)]
MILAAVARPRYAPSINAVWSGKVGVWAFLDFPANSPDLNVLDLGLFTAMQARQRRKPARALDELARAMSDERQSPPRKRARLASPSLPLATRDDAAADVDTAPSETVSESDAVGSEAPGASTAPPEPPQLQQAGRGEAPSPAAGPNTPRLPSLFPFVTPLLAPAAASTTPTLDEDAEMESAEVANATMMAVAQAEEASSTDDEELQQQLSMVGSADLKVVVDILSGEGGAEVKFEDLLNTVFLAAKEGKLPAILQCFQLIKRSDNAGELMKRAVAAEDETGLTLLMVSVRNNLLPLTSFLLHEGADVNHSNEKRTYALLLAAQKGLTDMTTFLLEHGANDESKNMRGCVCRQRTLFIVMVILSNEGMTALMLAAQRGHAKIATILLKSGSNVNKQTRQGSTALLLAAKRGHTAAVESLLTAGADIFLKDDREKTAAETANRRGHLDLFLKITVSNQLRLMREDLRRERSFTLMRLSTLYVLARADFAPAFHRPERRTEFELMDQTMRLPKPLLENIALYLPLCRLWDRQLRYLVYEAPHQPNRVVTQGIRILDEVLLAVSLEVRPSLRSLKRACDARQRRGGHLALLRDSPAYQAIFTSESVMPMAAEMLAQLRRMADVQGALDTYSGTGAIQFGGEVAQDVVALLTSVLYWNDRRKRALSSSIANDNDDTNDDNDDNRGREEPETGDTRMELVVEQDS